eukprot:522562_1
MNKEVTVSLQSFQKKRLLLLQLTTTIMAQKNRNNEISRNNESQFTSHLSVAELNYYNKLLPPSLSLINNDHEKSQMKKHNKHSESRSNCTISNYDGKADDEHNICKYTTLDTRIPKIFSHFDDTNGNDLLSLKQFNKKYKYENTIIETTNNYTINKISDVSNGEFKAMKIRNISQGEKYENDRKHVNDILSKWIIMRNLGILKECEIYNDKYSINCVQKLWDIDLKTYIK